MRVNVNPSTTKGENAGFFDFIEISRLILGVAKKDAMAEALWVSSQLAGWLGTGNGDLKDGTGTALRVEIRHAELSSDSASNSFGLGSPVFCTRHPPDFSRGISVHRGNAEPNDEIRPSGMRI